MAVLRKNRPIMEGLGSIFQRVNISKEIQNQLKESQKVLANQVHFCNSSGWRAIKKQYEAEIILLEGEIIGLTNKTEKNIDIIQQKNYMLRSMQEILRITDNIIEQFNLNQSQIEGEAQNTEPAQAG